MIAEKADKLACKLAELRYHYARNNSNIISMLEEAESGFIWNNTVAAPIISYGMKMYLCDKMDKIRQNLVDSFIREINNFVSETKAYPDSGVPSKKQKRFSKKVLKILEDSFNKDKYPSEPEKILLARKCYISLKQVNNWFTNKRNRSKSYRKDVENL